MSNKSRIEQNNIKINNNTNKIQSVANAVNTLSGITKTEYNACLTLVDSIDNIEDYSETTATADDIRLGKTAYSNGEKITGQLEIIENLTKYINNCSGLFDSNTNITHLNGFDCSSATSLRSMFNACSNLETVTLVNVTSKVTDFDNLFQNCSKLKEASISGNPGAKCLIQCTFSGCSSIERVSLPSTIKPKWISYMFARCEKLVDIPIMDTSELLSITDCFSSVPNLSDESLNKILLMFANATKYTDTKTLRKAGLSSDQATRCQSLSNYQAFIDAGWTTGY